MAQAPTNIQNPSNGEGGSVLSEQKGKTSTADEPRPFTEPNEGTTSPTIRAQFGNDGLGDVPSWDASSIEGGLHQGEYRSGEDMKGTVPIGSGDTGTLGSWPTGNPGRSVPGDVIKSMDPFGDEMFDQDHV